MSNHTPGPWVALRNDLVDPWGFQISGGGDPYLAAVGEWNASEIDEEQQANARLIAAAPEMFQALIAVREYIEVSYTEEHIFGEDWTPDAPLQTQSMLIRDARAVFKALAKAAGRLPSEEKEP